MKRTALGEVEHLILLAILRLGENAYGVSIVDAIREHTGREISVAAAYVALRRLENKKLVSGRTGKPTPERGGRAKRYFTVTPLGRERLEESASAIFRMWEAVDLGIGGHERD